MSQYLIRTSINTFPKILWSRGRLRVIVTANGGYCDEPRKIAHVELNHGPNGLGEDAWTEINDDDTHLLSSILSALVTGDESAMMTHLVTATP